MREGLWVDYIAHDGGPGYGATGYILKLDDKTAHVLWKNGSLRGDVGIHHVDDISPHLPGINASLRSSLDDSLEYGTVGATSVFDATERIADVCMEAASEALELVVSRLGASPIFNIKLSGHDPDEADLIIRATAKKAIREFIDEENGL